MKLKHIKNQNDFKGDDYSDTFAYFDRPYKCTCYCCNRPEMTGHLKSDDKKIGRVYEPWTCCDPRHEIYNEKEELRYVIVADCCQCGLCCRGWPCGKCSEAIFTIHKPNKDGSYSVENKEGQIKKMFNGCVKEMISDADNFELVFPVDATPYEKLMMIGAVLMIDYAFYESNSNDNNRNNY
jgi:hypothetical protein